MPITPFRRRNRLLLSCFLSFFGGGNVLCISLCSFFPCFCLVPQIKAEGLLRCSKGNEVVFKLDAPQARDTSASTVNLGEQALSAATGLFPCRGRKRVFCLWKGLGESRSNALRGSRAHSTHANHTSQVLCESRAAPLCALPWHHPRSLSASRKVAWPQLF